MSLATLRAVEERLASVVEASQRHLELTTALDPSAPCSRDIADRFQTLAGSIERLQSELQTVISTVVSQSRGKRVTAEPEAPAQEIDLIDLETETEDEFEELEQQKPSQQTALLMAEETARRLHSFVLATGEASAALDAETPRVVFQIPKALMACHRTGGKLLEAMEERMAVDEASASLFRDTVGRLASLAEDTRLDGKVKNHARPLVEVVKRLGRILEMADKVAGVPLALSDAVLRSARLKLKRCATKAAGERLTGMLTFVHEAQSRKGRKAAKKVGKPITQLVADLQDEMNMRKLYEKIDLPPWSEEQWTTFKEVAEALADWINCARKKSEPPKSLKAMVQTAGRFRQEFPDRFPRRLIRYIRCG
jgi:hypothetical protein